MKLFFLFACLVGVLTLLSLLGCSSIQQLDAPFSSLEEFEMAMEQLVEKENPPSISVAIVKDTQIVYVKAFGYADGPKAKSATPETAYQWWSITKLFTATAVLQLEENQQLDLDDPIQQYLPFCTPRKQKPGYDDITIRHLLTHSSGLGDIGMKILGWIHYEEDEPFNQTELLKSHWPKYNKLKAAPGKKVSYSNLGYLILAAIIEQVSGKAYDLYIQDHILSPLQMDGAGFDYGPLNPCHVAAGAHPKDLMGRVAFMMMDKKKALREKRNNRYWFNPIFSNQQGATGLIGSTQDLSSFMMAMLNEGQWQGTRLLSPENVVRMQSPQKAIDKSPMKGLQDPHFGFSWFIHKDNGQIALSHGGSGAAFSCQLRLYPEQDLGIAILSNGTYLEKDLGSNIISQLANIPWE